MAAVLAVFVVVMTAKVRDTTSDPYSTLLVSQSILENGTIKLNAYSHYLTYQHHAITYKGWYIYNFYPIGTSLFSVPFVWVANRMGYDMLMDESWTQVVIAAILCSAIFFVLYRISLCYVSPLAGLTIVSVSFFGSSLISSLGTALWSLNFTVFFYTLALLQIVRLETGRGGLNPYALGLLLFCAYLCRPTAAFFILIVFSFILLRHRRYFIKTAAVSFFFFLIYFGFNMYEFGKPLPPYYYYGSVLSFGTYWTALYGHLLSPARGLLVFSPFFIPVFFGSVVFVRSLWGNPIFLFSASWYLLHLLIISSWPGWWAGWSYGPRIQTDAIPAVILISFILYNEISRRGRFLQAAAVVLFLFLGAAGIFINAKQGLHNPFIQTWNGMPNINDNPQLLFDWKYPQFMATMESTVDRINDYKDLMPQ